MCEFQNSGSPPNVLTGGGDTPLRVNQFHNTIINMFGREPEFFEPLSHHIWPREVHIRAGKTITLLDGTG